VYLLLKELIKNLRDIIILDLFIILTNLKELEIDILTLLMVIMFKKMVHFKSWVDFHKLFLMKTRVTMVLLFQWELVILFLHLDLENKKLFKLYWIKTILIKKLLLMFMEQLAVEILWEDQYLEIMLENMF
jgi:hypothetical protein